MNRGISAIRTQMLIYGSVFGLMGGGLLGAGFISLIYSPFYDMNILLICMGTLATMLVGLVFGSLSGLLSGVGMAIVTTLFFQRPRFVWVHTVLMLVMTVSVTGGLFFQMAYLVGRPFIYDPLYKQSWVWALIVALTGATIASILTMQQYVTSQKLKVKNS